MTSQDIERGNRIIAEFDGWKYSKSGKTVRKDSYSSPYLVRDIQYYSSWDWLMPVVEKIESMGYRTCIDGGDKQFGNYCHIKKWTNDNELKHFIKEGQKDKIVSQQSTKINTVYPAVLQFLEWYNSQRSK